MTTRDVIDALQEKYKDAGQAHFTGTNIGNKLSSLHRVGKVARLALICRRW